MNSQNNNILLKSALQSAYELRTCPDSESLFVPEPDDNLYRHLSICHVCREKRSMTQDERNAWSALRDKFKKHAMKPGVGTERQAGQVWTIKKEFGGWREDGRFIKPPVVLLLESVEKTSGWRVAQLFGDKQLMGSSDVELGDQYGFAEAWNCYSLKDDRFEKCLGGVGSEKLQQVVIASAASHEAAPEGSILSSFRFMEIGVGAFVAVPAVMELVEGWETAQEKVYELMPGLKLALDGAKGFVLVIATDTLDLLRGTFRPTLVLRGSATKPVLPKLSDEQKKLIQEHCPVIPIDMKLVDGTLTVMLKWLREKPIELPLVSVFLNDIALDQASIITGFENIYIKHMLVSDITISQITYLKSIYVANVLSLYIEVDLERKNGF